MFVTTFHSDAAGTGLDWDFCLFVQMGSVFDGIEVANGTLPIRFSFPKNWEIMSHDHASQARCSKASEFQKRPRT